MNESFDVIVIGLGAHGSSALYYLSKTGLKVLGIDRFTPPHGYGSSHGQSRIIRQAYHESPFYVPFVQAAYGLWEELERESGKKLLIRTGGLLLGEEDTGLVRGARLSAEEHHVEYEFLDAADLRRRFPAFRPGEGTVGVWEKEAGILFPEECISAFLDGALAAGAGKVSVAGKVAAGGKVAIHSEEAVMGIKALGDGVEVTTSKGRYVAGRVIVSAGAWVGELLPELRLPLVIERQVVCWFKHAKPAAPDAALVSEHFLPGAMPVYIWEYMPGKMFYGFPDMGKGIKIGFHHGGRHIIADELRQDASAEEVGEIGAIAGRYLDIDPAYEASSVCMYTNTPDEHFIIDEYPGCSQILVVSPCSGHGFKFSSVVGRILSDWAMGEPAGFDLSPFAIGRLGV